MNDHSQHDQVTRRTFFQGLAATGLFAAFGAQTRAATPSVEPLPLFADMDFRLGANAWQMSPIARNVVGNILPLHAPQGKTAWHVAQWYSHNNIASAKPDLFPSGSTRFFDGSKTVIFGVSGSPEESLILKVDGITEYGGKTPAPGDPWPHLMFEQTALTEQRLDTLSSISFAINYKLLHSKPAPWADPMHTAQFRQNFTVRNCNPDSPGFGDYFWCGVHMYDARYLYPHALSRKDVGSAKKQATGKFIFNPAGETFASRPAVDGQWHAISIDLLPIFRKGLQAAADDGFLADSHAPKDFAVQTTTLGWEVSGPIDVAMQIRGLSVNAVPLH